MSWLVSQHRGVRHWRLRLFSISGHMLRLCLAPHTGGAQVHFSREQTFLGEGGGPGSPASWVPTLIVSPMRPAAHETSTVCYPGQPHPRPHMALKPVRFSPLSVPWIYPPSVRRYLRAFRSACTFKLPRVPDSPPQPSPWASHRPESQTQPPEFP